MPRAPPPLNTRPIRGRVDCASTAACAAPPGKSRRPLAAAHKTNARIQAVKTLRLRSATGDCMFRSLSGVEASVWIGARVEANRVLSCVYCWSLTMQDMRAPKIAGTHGIRSRRTCRGRAMAPARASEASCPPVLKSGAYVSRANAQVRPYEISD